MTQELLAELTDCEANRLRKWGSLWLDLLQVDMALHERAKLPNSLATTIMRRALWESAVISYGRMGFSDVRNLEYEELLETVGGDSAKAFHGQVMGWRHGHVAHRTDKAYEETATVAQHADGNSSDPEALNLLISTWVGPDDDSPWRISSVTTPTSCGSYCGRNISRPSARGSLTGTARRRRPRHHSRGSRPKPSVWWQPARCGRGRTVPVSDPGLHIAPRHCG
jgi:hypothetical protein